MIQQHRYLVTGHTGFVGGHFSNHVGVENVIGMPESIDLVDFEKTREFVTTQKFDAVLHLAARSSVAESFEKPELTQDVNVGGTRNLLRALTLAKFKGPVLLVSSGEVYGAVDESNLPVKETSAIAPRNPYAQSKVLMEELVTKSTEFSDALFRTTIARPFNHIGPKQASHFVVANFVQQLARRKAGLESGPMKTGDLTVTRDFTDVRDIVAGYQKIISNGKSGQVYNLGSGVETRLQSILEVLIEISGTGTRVETDPSRLRPGEQRRMCADVSKVKREIGWSARIPLKTTLVDCFEAAFEKIKETTAERTLK